jgi:hypothetical protein
MTRGSGEDPEEGAIVMRLKIQGWKAALGLAVVTVSTFAVLTLSSGKLKADEIEIKWPPPDGSCLCPADFHPVICTGSDGSRAAFSNGCVAGCYGYTQCAAYHPM